MMPFSRWKAGAVVIFGPKAEPRMNPTPPSLSLSLSRPAAVTFETAAWTTTAIGVPFRRDKGRVLQMSDYSTLPAPLSPPPPRHVDTRMWVNFDHDNDASAPLAGGGVKRKPLWPVVIPDISHLHGPPREGLTAVSYFYSSAKSLVYIGRG